MELLHGWWVTVMVWVPAPVRLGVFVSVVIVVVLRGVPLVLRVAGAGLQRSRPALELLTYPEFLATTTARSLGRRPPPGTFAYGNALGALHATLVPAGQLLARVGRHQVKPGPFLLGAPLALALVVWYLPTDGAQGEFGRVARTAQVGLVRADTWLMDGAKIPAGPAVCPPAPAKPSTPPKTPPKPRPTPKRSAKAGP